MDMSEQRIGGGEEKEVQTEVSDRYNYMLCQRGVLVPPWLQDLRGSLPPPYPIHLYPQIFAHPWQ